MPMKNRIREAKKRCSLCGSRGPFKKIQRGAPRGTFVKKRDRHRHFWLCLRCGI